MDFRFLRTGQVVVGMCPHRPVRHGDRWPFGRAPTLVGVVMKGQLP
jgi:hypothetical protein